MMKTTQDWLAVRASSRAGSLLQLGRVHLKDIGRLSGRLREQARSHRDRGHLQEIGRLSGRHREQARSYRRAKAERRTPAALHHSSGRALARLQLLILIHPPPRKAEWRCSSGDGRAAPFDAVEHAACRSKRSRPEGSVPGWIPERRNPEP
ncbi:hypothetical protein D3C87_1377090 [compost metagenome]